MKKILHICSLLIVGNIYAITFTSGGVNYIGTDTAPYTASVGQNYSYIGVAVIPPSVVREGVSYSVTSIGDNAFYNCTGLTSISIPNSVTSIADYSFYSCYGLTSVSIPNSVTSIGSQAFYFCTGLSSLSIPNAVTTIGSSAFYYCTGLTSISIAESVTSIGNYAFGNCSSLSAITVSNSVPVSIGFTVFFNLTYSNISLTVPTGSSAVYNTALVWQNFNPITESNALSVNTLGDRFLASIYPNPVQDILKIQSDKEVQFVELFNLQGQKVKTFNQKQLAISDLSSGVYIIKITTLDNIEIIKRFIKK